MIYPCAKRVFVIIFVLDRYAKPIAIIGNYSWRVGAEDMVIILVILYARM